MSHSHDNKSDDANKQDDVASRRAAVGKRSLTDALIQRKATGGGSGASASNAYESATAGSGSEVPHRAEMERGFGTSFSDVQAHTGKSAAMSSIEAEAATLGTDSRIAFADTSPSKQTVAHELAHVVQARNNGGASGGVQTRSTVSQPSDAAEVQAESAATVVAGGGTVDASSLRTFGSGIMRKDVKVSAGKGKKDTESTTRVEDQGNTFEDQVDVWTKLTAWKDGTSITFSIKATASSYSNVTRAPTDNDALRFFYEATIGIRRRVYMNESGILKRICARFSQVDAARIMGLCDFPLLWKVRHWFGDTPAPTGPTARDLILRFIRNSPMGQKLEVCKHEDAIEHVTKLLASDNPENVFGDAIKTHLYPDAATQTTFDAAHPKFAAWRGTATKLDAEARWNEVGAGPVAAIAKLKTESAMGGRNNWTSLVHWGPRGLALSDSMRANIDKAALTAAVSVADRADLFLTRWNHPFTDPGAAFDKVKAVWKQLMKLPPGIVTSEMIQGVALRPAVDTGEYIDMPWAGTFGTWWTGTAGSLKHTAHTVRHEVGHAADVQAGGFSNLSSQPPIVWKRWMMPTPWLQEIINYMDASTGGGEAAAWMALMTAAYNTAPFVSPFGPYVNTPGPDTALQKQQKLWGRVATQYNAGNDINPALKLLKRHGKHTANPKTVRKIIALARIEDYPGSKPSYLRDHFFLKKYGEHYSYHKTGGNEVWARNGKKGLSSYTLCSPYEYYADMFAAYYATDTNRDKNVPGWTSGYFKALTEKHDATAVDKPSGGLYDTTALGNANAAQTTGR